MDREGCRACYVDLPWVVVATYVEYVSTAGGWIIDIGVAYDSTCVGNIRDVSTCVGHASTGVEGSWMT